MTTATHEETLGFQTEVKQLLNLMIHSLYSNREIFLRELISNAADACDKLRYAALDNDALYEGDSELRIEIEHDRDANTITLRDNGIGMNREDVIANLGTIARSGTAEFLKQLSGEQQKDAKLIGQFGVGFYSAFIVADEVVVRTRKAGTAASEGVEWRSKGEGEFTVADIERDAHGTEITLHLKDDAKEFADDYRLQSLVRKYSDHIEVPVRMPKVETAKDDDGNEIEGSEVTTWETVNEATALWARPKSEISDDEYKAFYKHVAHDFSDPLTWSHNKVEGKLEYTSLLYVPGRAPFDMFDRDGSRGVKLYVQRVFIMDDAEQFLPLYLRFAKGVIDSNDLSLNVSREILQKDRQVESMKSAVTKRVLDLLGKIAENDKEKYQSFWEAFGSVLKEGPAEDFSNREKIAGLLRFTSTHENSDKQTVSLADYVSRMKEDQTKIYYLIGESYNAAKNSPHLEIFRKKGIEVLLMSDRIDEWMMNYLHEFDGKHMQNLSKTNLEEENLLDEEEKKQQEAVAEESKDLIERLKKSLENEVSEVKATQRLTESPACLVLNSFDMGIQMREIMKAAGQALPDSKPILEINPNHPLIEQLEKEDQEDRFKDFALVIFEQATLAEGGSLSDPADYVRRMNKLLLELSSKS